MKIKTLSAIFLFLMAATFTNDVLAETKVFVREYAYQASEVDSKVSSRRNATEEVKRILLEELGTYIESETIVANLQLTKDQIIAITGGIVKIEILMENWDGQKYWLKASLKTDPNDLAKNIERIRQDRKLTRELETVKKKADEANKENERLRKELDLAKKDKTNIAPYNKMVDKLQNRQSEGDKYLAKAKELAKIAGKETEAGYYRKLAIDKLGFTFVNEELPEFVIHFPGQYTFQLKAGEQTPYWITFPTGSLPHWNIGSKDDRFLLKYNDGEVVQAWSAISTPANKYTFKFVAVTDQEEIKMIIK